jgi:phosphoglycerate kinase
LNDAEKKLPSSYMIAKYYPKKSFIGPLCKKELDNVKTLTINSMHPTTYVIGGSHIYNKINAIYSAANHLDYLLVGGITSFTFLKMYDIDVPYYEEGTIDEVHNVSLILKKKIYMPLDFLETDSLSNISGINEVLIHDMHSNNVIGDIGQKTINEYLSILDTCKSVLFYGPVGLCEINEFQNGTYQILNKLKELTTKGVYTFIGGIELIIAMKALGFNASDFSYVSVAGNNTLSLLEHIILPILEIIPNKS